MEKPLIVSINNKYYDIRNFVKKHPGGQKILLKIAGEDIESYMNGSKAVFNIKHPHSKAAYGILQRYALDHSFKQDSLIDSEKAILWRVGELKENYWSWIHQPYDGSLRLFDSYFLENLTRTNWWMVPLIWMPLVILFAFNGLELNCQKYGLVMGIVIAISLFLIGNLAWTLLEYSLHRGVFHWRPNPNSYAQITFHFLLHGLHHKTPMDGDRLVFPPAAAAIIIGFFYILYQSIFSWSIFCCYASGKLFGYICYDVIHYYLHHGLPNPNSNMYYRKLYHHNHHFKDVNMSFGISTMLWDHVFGTVGVTPLL